jgi:iron-sulfur cluster repair protein YtfE (RIC family)
VRAARKVVPATEDHVLESVDAKVTVLMENIRHHVEEEEQDWFPEVRKGMGRKARGTRH